jgi:hypothetical protein
MRILVLMLWANPKPQTLQRGPWHLNWALGFCSIQTSLCLGLHEAVLREGCAYHTAAHLLLDTRQAIPVTAAQRASSSSIDSDGVFDTVHAQAPYVWCNMYAKAYVTL